MLQGVIFDIQSVLSDTEALYKNNFIHRLKASGLKIASANPSSHESLHSCAMPLDNAPVPDIFLSLAKNLRLSLKECLVITDSEAGTIAAAAAGIPCVGFAKPHSVEQKLSCAYALLESFESADADYLYRTHAHALSYPARILTTERLFIREFSREDFPALYAMYAKPETTSFMDEVPSDYSTEFEKHLAYISGIYPLFDLALWGVFEKNTGTLIGRAGFSLPEDTNETFSLGYLIDVPYRRHGYAKECVSALLSYAKRQGASHISVKIKKSNIASQKTLEHCCTPYLFQRVEIESALYYHIHL